MADRSLSGRLGLSGRVPETRLDVGYTLDARPRVRLPADYGFPARRPDEGALTLRLQLAVQ